MATSKILEHFGNMHQIIAEDEKQHQGGLYLGDRTAAEDMKLLSQKNIRTVLTCGGNMEIYYSQKVVHHVYEEMVDNDQFNISLYFPETNLAIQEGLNRGGVLVHCAAGISRSASIVIAYLITRNNWSFPQAFYFVKNKRIVICPNSGFINQLKIYDKQLQKTRPKKVNEIMNIDLSNQVNTSFHSRALSASNARRRSSYLNGVGNFKDPLKNLLEQQLENQTQNRKFQQYQQQQQYQDQELQQGKQKIDINDINFGNSPNKKHFLIKKKYGRSNSQAKLQKLADKLVKEESELAYNKFEYKPGFKRLNSQEKGKNKNQSQNNINVNEFQIEQEKQALQRRDREYMQIEKKLQQMEQIEDALIHPYEENEDSFVDFNSYRQKTKQLFSRTNSANSNRNKENFSSYASATHINNKQFLLGIQNLDESPKNLANTNKNKLPPRPGQKNPVQLPPKNPKKELKLTQQKELNLNRHAKNFQEEDYGLEDSNEFY